MIKLVTTHKPSTALGNDIRLVDFEPGLDTLLQAIPDIVDADISILSDLSGKLFSLPKEPNRLLDIFCKLAVYDGFNFAELNHFLTLETPKGISTERLLLGLLNYFGVTRWGHPEQSIVDDALFKYLNSERTDDDRRIYADELIRKANGSPKTRLPLTSFQLNAEETHHWADFIPRNCGFEIASIFSGGATASQRYIIIILSNNPDKLNQGVVDALFDGPQPNFGEHESNPPAYINKPPDQMLRNILARLSGNTPAGFSSLPHDIDAQSIFAYQMGPNWECQRLHDNLGNLTGLSCSSGNLCAVFLELDSRVVTDEVCVDTILDEAMTSVRSDGRQNISNEELQSAYCINDPTNDNQLIISGEIDPQSGSGPLKRKWIISWNGTQRSVTNSELTFLFLFAMARLHPARGPAKDGIEIVANKTVRIADRDTKEFSYKRQHSIYADVQNIVGIGNLPLFVDEQNRTYRRLLCSANRIDVNGIIRASEQDDFSWAGLKSLKVLISLHKELSA